MKDDTLALIVAPPGRLSDGWRALLMATPQIAEVQLACCTSSALETLETLDPDLVLYDAEPFGNKRWDVLSQIKAQWPRCRCITLVSSARQRREALAVGADHVLIKGFPADQLSVAVKHLLKNNSE
jgi:DNA-binding NarL/FixJ family response regulator